MDSISAFSQALPMFGIGAAGNPTSTDAVNMPDIGPAATLTLQGLQLESQMVTTLMNPPNLGGTINAFA